MPIKKTVFGLKNLRQLSAVLILLFTTTLLSPLLIQCRDTLAGKSTCTRHDRCLCEQSACACDAVRMPSCHMDEGEEKERRALRRGSSQLLSQNGCNCQENENRRAGTTQRLYCLQISTPFIAPDAQFISRMPLSSVSDRYVSPLEKPPRYLTSSFA